MSDARLVCDLAVDRSSSCRYVGHLCYVRAARPARHDSTVTEVMDNRLILPLLCAASVAFAAAPFSHAEKPTAPANRHSAENGAPLVTTFDITRPKNDTDKLRFTLNVRNNTSKMLELQFPDGQTHDFVVKDFTGKEIWRWGEGRMFTSAMRSETLKGKGHTIFAESWDTKGQHGSFTALAILRSNNFPVETSVQFVLP